MKISKNVSKAKNFLKHFKSFTEIWFTNINRKVWFIININKHRIEREDLKILDLFWKRFLSISLISTV